MATPRTDPNQRHAFKGLADWIEVFKAGDHVDSKGRSCSFTEADLDEMVANGAGWPPPAVIGHPKHNHPAYAWGREIKREGPKLFVKFADIHPAFEAGVDSGAYRNRSVSIVKTKDAGWRVQHVGWLGAVPPAIEGLQALDYSASADDAHEFASSDSSAAGWALGSVATLLRGLRDYVISKDGLDTANTVLPDWTIASVASASATLLAMPEDGMPSYSANPTGAGMSTYTEDDLQRARDEAATAATAAAIAQTQAQFAAQGLELSELRAQRLNERIATQLNGWKAAGRLLPAEEAGMAEFMASLDAAAGEFEFAAADGSKPKKTPAVFFAEFMAARAPVVKLGARTESDLPTQVDMSSAASIVQAATAWQFEQSQKGITVSVDEAVQHVKDTNAKGA